MKYNSETESKSFPGKVWSTCLLVVGVEDMVRTSLFMHRNAYSHRSKIGHTF